MKKLFVILVMTALAALSLTACSIGATRSTTTATEAPADTEVPSATDAPTAAPEITVEPAAEATVEAEATAAN